MKKKKNNRIKRKLKKGDRVVVIAGASKGVKGEILRVYPVKGKVIVENVKIVKKHLQPTQEDQGGIVEQEAPIDISNVMLLDPKNGEPTKVGRKYVNGKLERYSKKSGEIIKE